MKTSDPFFIGDRVSVRCPQAVARGSREIPWLAGRIIARDANSPITRLHTAGATRTRYVVQLDDQRRVVAFDDEVRRWTLAFDLLETLEKLAS